jgi:hypothetical protein
VKNEEEKEEGMKQKLEKIDKLDIIFAIIFLLEYGNLERYPEELIRMRHFQDMRHTHCLIMEKIPVVMRIPYILKRGEVE